MLIKQSKLSTALVLGTVLSFTVVSSTAVAETPKWVHETSDYCRPTQLCAVGEATGKMGAGGNARAELGRIFETRVQSEATTVTEASEKSGSMGLSGELSESLMSILKESSDEILQGAEIEASFEAKDRYYALAVLDRNKAANILTTKMKELDEKNVVLFEEGKRTGLYRIFQNFEVRSELNERYQVLKGGSYESPLSFSDVMKKKALQRQNRTQLTLELKDGSSEESLMPFLVSLLLEMDFKISAGPEARYHLSGALTPIPQHMKVKGFEKYLFVFDLVAKDASGVKVGALKSEVVETGRSMRHAQERALEQIKNEILKTIDQLNIN